MPQPHLGRGLRWDVGTGSGLWGTTCFLEIAGRDPSSCSLLQHMFPALGFGPVKSVAGGKGISEVPLECLELRFKCAGQLGSLLLLLLSRQGGRRGAEHNRECASLVADTGSKWQRGGRSQVWWGIFLVILVVTVLGSLQQLFCRQTSCEVLRSSQESEGCLPPLLLASQQSTSVLAKNFYHFLVSGWDWSCCFPWMWFSQRAFARAMGQKWVWVMTLLIHAAQHWPGDLGCFVQICLTLLWVEGRGCCGCEWVLLYLLWYHFHVF